MNFRLTSYDFSRSNFFASYQNLSTNLGGGKQDRTADLLHAMQALSQLSYTPNIFPKISRDFLSLEL